MTKPKISWPQTPADVRRFIGANFVSIKHGEKPEDTRYMVTIHDLLSAFSDWVFFGCEPEPQPQQEPSNKYCCHACFNESGQVFLDRMILCPECGNKRCPKASHHNLPCTNSNEPNQAGSVYTTPPQQQPQQDPVAWANLSELSAHFESVNCGTAYQYPGEGRQPLYTAPPQRQSLTDVSIPCNLLPKIEDFIGEAIETMEVAGVIIKPDAHQLLADVRAAAHGIK